RMPAQSQGGVQDVNDIAVFEGDSNIIYFVGNVRSNPQRGGGFRSHDNGQTWEAFGSDGILQNNARGGRIAVSAIDQDKVLWIPLDNAPYLSYDGGRTWQQVDGMTETGLVRDVWDTNRQLAANK